MRISDWSSDVCSSDLTAACFDPGGSSVRRWRRSGAAGDCGGADLARGGQLGRRGCDDRPGGCLCRAARTVRPGDRQLPGGRSEEHTSELQSLMRRTYGVYCLTKKKQDNNTLLQT